MSKLHSQQVLCITLSPEYDILCDSLGCVNNDSADTMCFQLRTSWIPGYGYIMMEQV